MKFTCPNCKIKVSKKEIKNINKKSIHIEKQCPACKEWFCLNKNLMYIKTFAIFLLLITSLLNIFSFKSEYSIIFSIVGLAAIFVALMIAIFGKSNVVEIKDFIKKN